jgi:hypothetical protein
MWGVGLGVLLMINLDPSNGVYVDGSFVTLYLFWAMKKNLV